MTKTKTRRFSSSPQLVVFIVLLIFLPLLVFLVKQKTNLLGEAVSLLTQSSSLYPSLSDQTQQESFETGFGGWEKGAWMPPGKAWSLERVQERPKVNPPPYDGKWEIAAYQDGRGDDGTVWLTKAFRAEPNSQYEINLSFYLWSSQKSVGNQWSVVTYEGLVKPEIKNSPDQWRFFEEIGYTNEVAGWKQYSYRKVITTGPRNSIWLAFGQHVNWETERTYYWDLVEVQIKNISPKPTPTPTPAASYQGVIQKLEASICRQGTHQLVSSSPKLPVKESLILLQSKTYNLDKYLGKRVELGGKTTPLVECKGILVDVTFLKPL